MNWKDLQKKMIAKNDKELCMNFAIACAEKASEYTDSQIVIETLAILKDSKWNFLGDNFNDLAKERISHSDLSKKEAAHALIHASELPSVRSIQSMAGHAARAGEALSRIGEQHCLDIVAQFGLGE